ncbi:hypothetical protein KRR26_34450 [Corallococcus sp. M34]|uniref:hypothetical protein n=1 Tax=Citreicoccus inhibens TaxID=2849499 RepID=UPI001C22F71F|nr:hypothetical protein [Citreicoccus inhibens]MBU8900720.1 hypothetical protein [Citreicoccus inhibens]
MALIAPPAALAKAAVQRFFTTAPWHIAMERYGWELSMLDELTLIVGLCAPAKGGAAAEKYTLRVTCDYYPAYPPDVRFVNPTTLQYNAEQDVRHLAHLVAPYCYVHARYQGGGDWVDYPYCPQLVCSSLTLGYYASNHSPTEAERWRPSRDTIFSSIQVVHQALHSEYYQGRMG